MRKLVVYNNKIVINDYNYGDLPELERKFELFDKATHTYYSKAAIYDSNTRTMTIPKGTNIKYLERLLNVYADYDNSYIKPVINNEKILVKYPPKDEDQANALKFLIGIDEFSYTNKYSQLMIALGTGKGKTYLGIAYAAYLNMKTIIITTSSKWLEQWNTRILEHTNCLSKQLHMIQGSYDINNLLCKTEEQLSCYNVYTVTHATLLSYAKENGWDSIGNLFSHLGIGLRIYDEAHLNFDNIYNIDYNASIYKTIYLTATPSRGDKMEDKIYQHYFASIPIYSVFNPETDPHTHYRAFRYKSGINAFEVSKCINKFGFNKMKYCDIVIKKKNFDYISRIVMDFISRINGKKLIFLATNDAIVFFYNWIYDNYPEYNNNVGIFTSINPDKSSALNNTIILTTTKSAGAAMDIPGLMVTVNLAEPTKSPPQNQQRFGRTRAYNSYYLDIVDTSLKVTNNYYVQSLPMFENQALTMSDIVFNDEMLEKTAFNIMYQRYTHGLSPFIQLHKKRESLFVKMPLNYLNTSSEV